ncbi:MAG: hypothetical protein MRK01_03995 [Candidatus Scalindua sp.]|nr:hypothetical protein [Candidatus Scalindua sp.]
MLCCAEAHLPEPCPTSSPFRRGFIGARGRGGHFERVMPVCFCLVRSRQRGFSAQAGSMHELDKK